MCIYDIYIHIYAFRQRGTPSRKTHLRILPNDAQRKTGLYIYIYIYIYI